jgi:hypothetical protein
MPEEEWSKYEAKFDRCVRIEAKRSVIDVEIDDFYRRHKTDIGMNTD